MKIRVNPAHEGLLAGLLMVLALTAMVGVVAHDYAGRLPPGVVDDIYQNPMLSIRVAGRQIRTLLAEQTPLGDLDKLYDERTLTPLAVEPEDDDTEVTPTEAGTVEEVPEAEFRVTGIAWSNRRPVAFINGRGVTIGHSIEGWRIVGIARESVTLKDEDGNEKKIELYGNSNR